MRKLLCVRGKWFFDLRAHLFKTSADLDRKGELARRKLQIVHPEFYFSQLSTLKNVLGYQLSEQLDSEDR